MTKILKKSHVIVNSILEQLMGLEEVQSELICLDDTTLLDFLLSGDISDVLNDRVPNVDNCKDIDILTITMINMYYETTFKYLIDLLENKKYDDKELKKYSNYCDLTTSYTFAYICNLIEKLKSIFGDKFELLNTKLIALHFISNIQPRFCTIKKMITTRQ